MINSDLLKTYICLELIRHEVLLTCGNNHPMLGKCAEELYGKTNTTGELLQPENNKKCPYCNNAVQGYLPNARLKKLIDDIYTAKLENNKLDESENPPTNQVSEKIAQATGKVCRALQDHIQSLLFKSALCDSNDQTEDSCSTAYYRIVAMQLEEEIKLLKGDETLSELQSKYSPTSPLFLQEVNRWIEEKNLLIVCNKLTRQQFTSADESREWIVDRWVEKKNLLTVCNKLPRQQFTSADEARKWINDPNNTQGIKEADLSRLGLTRLPKEIGNLESLTILSFKNNNLTTLPASLGKLKSLELLDLHDNNLTALPNSIGDLSKLLRLYLNKNRLTTLPASIGNLKSLIFLYLDNNRLTDVPDSIGDLSKLLQLYLENNSLKALPYSIGKLESLQELFLQDNQLTTLPASFGSLSKLTILLLNGNNIDYDLLPEEIMNCENEAIQKSISRVHP